MRRALPWPPNKPFLQVRQVAQKRIIENMSFYILWLTCKKKSFLGGHGKARRTNGLKVAIMKPLLGGVVRSVLSSDQCLYRAQERCLTDDPKSRNGGTAERRNGGKSPQILKHGTAENDSK